MAAIDKIVITTNGVQRILNPTQWKALPITERVKLLSEGTQFFAGSESIPPKVAITQLR